MVHECLTKNPWPRKILVDPSWIIYEKYNKLTKEQTKFKTLDDPVGD